MIINTLCIFTVHGTAIAKAWSRATVDETTQTISSTLTEQTMEYAMTRETLKTENHVHRGTGGRSEENRSSGFRPAFMDTQTCRGYPPRFAEGRPAPVHHPACV